MNMGKRRTNTKPGQNGHQAAAAAIAEPTEDVEECTTLIEAPLGEVPEGANSDMVHINLNLTREQSHALRRLRLGLKANRETCKTGQGREHFVESFQDTLRWLLEAI